MNFLRNFFASFLALVVFSLFGFFMLIAVVAAMESEGEVSVSSNSVLHINLNRQLADRSFNDPFSDLGFGGGESKKIGVIDLKKALTQAASDDKIKGIVLLAPSLKGGFAMGAEVRAALVEFKSSGKFIMSYADYLTEGGFYLSSVADELYVSPAGGVEWNGLSSNTPFLKGTFEKLDIKPQIFRVGTYKSAVEPLILDKMSDASRLQTTSFLNSIYNYMISEMAPDLDMTEAKLKNISDKMLAQNLTQATELGLITATLYKDQFLQKVADKIEVEDAEDIEFVSFQEYNKSFYKSNSSKNKIAVIIAEGDIVDGKGGKGQIGSDKFTREIRKARENDKVKAIVLRVSSPGGSALASDLIWREVVKARESKPVIASFGNYAASGGYYISMAADTIVSQPNTITGSIGIFGIVFNMGDFMANKLGITTDGVSTGDFSDMMTSSRALTEAEKRIIQNSVEEGYDLFTSKAAEGRGMNIDDLKAIASGRVWTGTQAKENGLVDVLGDLDDAIAIAAEKAGITDDYKVRYYPEQKTALEEILEELESSTQAKLMKAQLGDMYPYAQILEQVKSMRGLQARLLYDVEFQ
ncbi:MAG: signal peptide peptidase SppA [Cyclobacteriaceae bacterium]|nr:signal peptide peptidase SppA [Cyclobacteriaceae bacterium]